MATEKLTLTVKSTAGNFTDTYNENNRAQKVFDEALRHFRLVQGSGATYVLLREADRGQLDLSEKLEDLGLVNGDVLILQASQAQDG